MREIEASTIRDTVARLCQEANFELPEDVVAALRKAREVEESPAGQTILDQILLNAQLARSERMPLCQDCGTAVVNIDIGQDVHIVGGDLEEALNDGVRKGYAEGYLRKSMVTQPFSARVNTRDNTPPIIHTHIVAGDKVKIQLMPKGGGSENMSALGTLKPAQGRQGVVDFVVKAVEAAGGNPCPPIIVGVGIGGSAEKALEIAKRALFRKVGEHSPDAELAQLETDLL
ncbi:MAG: fumarate hydratase, partial [Chloroflexi bacterium]|nr:fumarate hydratase [Chloroflexota bacterium]